MFDAAIAAWNGLRASDQAASSELCHPPIIRRSAYDGSRISHWSLCALMARVLVLRGQILSINPLHQLFQNFGCGGLWVEDVCGRPQAQGDTTLVVVSRFQPLSDALRRV